MRHFRHPQAGAIGDAERGPVLDTRRRLEQPANLLDAQHIGQLPGITGQYQAARQVGPVERHAEQEAQRRDRTVDGGCSGTVLALVKLEPADILSARGIGGLAQECGEAQNVTNIVALGTRQQTAHRHIVEHALAKRGDRTKG